MNADAPGPVDRAGTLVRRVAAAATAAMLVISWPLWVGSGDDFPRVPFVAGWPQTTGAAAWGLYGALLAAVVGTAAATAGAWRPWFRGSLGVFVVLVGQDQHRFQPWVYQYAMTVMFLAALPGGRGLKYARWWFVALYLHSGLSKLDRSFCDELGPVFLRGLVGSLGIDPARWSLPLRTASVLAMPGGEIAVAWALATPGFARIGRAGAVGFHALLIAVLGPWGLDHSAIVLVWNGAMMAEVWFAFGVDPGAGSGALRRPWPVVVVFWAGVLLPFGERWGVWDAWPSHALYASHVERVAILVDGSDVGRFPAGVRRHWKGVEGGPWKRLDLTGWSRAVRGTPVYPQNRACLGLAEALSARYGGPLPLRVVAFGTADRWTGWRRREQADGVESIRTLGDRFWWNAHPWTGLRGGR